MKGNNKLLTLCSSASFYRQILLIKNRLEKKGYRVLIPSTAYKMKKVGNFNVDNHKIWYKKPSLIYLKTKLILDHFKKIKKSDAILVVNLNKKGIKGYIGGNVLMEMAVAFYLAKPIFIYQKIKENHPFFEEILAMNPVFIEKDLEKIKL